MLEFIVATLATWRIASALYYEYGPGDVWLKSRNQAALKSPFWDKQLKCFWCCTFWAALLVLPFYLWFWWPLLPIAFSGGALLLTHGGRTIWRETTDHGQG